MEKTKIGWVHDFNNAQHPGGAQQTNRVMLDNVPDHLEIYEVSPDHFDLGCDLYIINNIRTFTREQALVLLSKPHVNWFHDIIGCPHQHIRVDVAKKDALVNIFLSPLLADAYESKFNVELEGYIVPSAMEISRFTDVTRPEQQEDNWLWVGDIQLHKGIDDVLLAARAQNKIVDFWGFGNKQLIMQIQNSNYGKIKGYYPQDEIENLYAMYSTFIHLPSGTEAFGRTVAEAMLAGCTTITNGNVGLNTIANNREELIGQLQLVPETFWGLIEKALP